MNGFFGGREDEEKTREWSFIYLFSFPLQNWPFGAYIYKKNHIHLLVHGHYSWSTFGLHLVKGLKALLIDILKKSDHGSWTMEKAIFHGPWCKPALRLQVS